MLHSPTAVGFPPTRLDQVLPVEPMHTMLHRARLRSDRSGAPFAVVTWKVTPQTADRGLAALRMRLRQTDVIGYAAANVIGAFLPDTPAAGAWKVADDIAALLPGKLPQPHCEVYVYPDPLWQDEEHENQLPMRDGNGNGRPGSRNGNGSPAHGNGNGNGRRGHDGIYDDSISRAQGLRKHFAQPLPVWKRGIDILGALGGIAVFSPLFLAAAAAVKLTSPGPVFFFQRRAGLGGRPFTLWKFRTMRVGAEKLQQEIMHLNEQDGAAFKIKNDPRVTPVGSLLRKTSIDELPQLWNVLRGDMSLVGPRPLPVHEAESCLQWQQRRVDVTPGVTCIWQAHGRSRVTFEEWMRMDLRYARRRTLWRDLVLILQTIPAVLLRRGAS